MRPLRILYFIRYPPFDNRAGGGEIIAWNTMKKLAERGHKIDAIIGKTCQHLPEIAGVNFHITPPLKPGISSYDWLRKSRGLNPNVIHGFYAEAMLVYFFNRKKAIVHEVHHPRIYPFSLGETIKERSIRFSIYLHMNKYASLLSSKIVVPSEYSKREVVKKYKAREEKIEVVSNPVDTSIFRDYGIERDPNRLVTVGRLGYQKGFDILLLAFEKISKLYPHAKLEIIGDGPLRKELKKMCKTHHIPNVTFHGFLAGQDIAESLNRSSIFVLASRYESSPLVIMEAMACGLPIVATKVGGVPEIGIENECGFCVNPENTEDLVEKVLFLLNDKTLRYRFGRAAIKKAENFTWEKRISKIERIYSSLGL